MGWLFGFVLDFCRFVDLVLAFCCFVDLVWEVGWLVGWKGRSVGCLVDWVVVGWLKIG